MGDVEGPYFQTVARSKCCAMSKYQTFCFYCVCQKFTVSKVYKVSKNAVLFIFFHQYLKSRCYFFRGLVNDLENSKLNLIKYTN